MLAVAHNEVIDALPSCVFSTTAVDTGGFNLHDIFKSLPTLCCSISAFGTCGNIEGACAFKNIIKHTAVYCIKLIGGDKGCYVCKFAATPERVVSYACNTIAYCYVCEAAAKCERVISYACHTLSCCYPFKAVAMTERVVSVAYCYFCEAATIRVFTTSYYSIFCE